MVFPRQITTNSIRSLDLFISRNLWWVFLYSLQVIPLLSLAIVIVGALHLDDCQVQPLLPIWHIVAGASGLCTPFFYLLFDDVSPWLTRRFPGISDFIDNAVVCFLPIYIVFEVAWLITGKICSFLAIIVKFWRHF